MKGHLLQHRNSGQTHLRTSRRTAYTKIVAASATGGQSQRTSLNFFFFFACNVERGTRFISPCRVLGSAQKPLQAAVQKQIKLKATTHTRACRVSQVPPSRIFLFHFVHSTFSQAQHTGMHEESMITTRHYTRTQKHTHSLRIQTYEVTPSRTDHSCNSLRFIYRSS